jgi:hypothetical protein
VCQACKRFYQANYKERSVGHLPISAM